MAADDFRMDDTIINKQTTLFNTINIICNYMHSFQITRKVKAGCIHNLLVFLSYHFFQNYLVCWKVFYLESDELVDSRDIGCLLLFPFSPNIKNKNGECREVITHRQSLKVCLRSWPGEDPGFP